MLLVVDARVEAQLLDHVITLLAAAGEPDRTAAASLRELPHHASHCAARGADGDRLAGLGLADSDEAVPRRHARHTHGAEICRQRNTGRVDLAQHAARAAVDDTVLLPAAHTDNGIADSE